MTAHDLASRAVAVLPTYNERANLPVVVEAILRELPSIHIFVVDDHSPDGTGIVAEELALQNPSRITVLHRERKEGLGRAYVHAFQEVLRRPFEYVIQMDADLSHDPKYLPEMLTAAAESDLVIGSRYLTGINVVNWDFKRLLLSKGATFYSNLLTGLRVTDSTGGFKCWRAGALRRLDLNEVFSSGYLFQIEMTLRATRAGFRIAEVPIIFYERRIGESKIDLGVITEAAFGTLRLALTSRLPGFRSRNEHRVGEIAKERSVNA